jgi:hypothetical protein
LVFHRGNTSIIARSAGLWRRAGALMLSGALHNSLPGCLMGHAGRGASRCMPARTGTVSLHDLAVLILG